MRIAFKTDVQEVPERRPSHRGTSRTFRIVFLAVVGVSALALLGTIVGDGGVTIIYQQNKVRKDLEVRISAEENRRLRLLARVESLQSDPSELERVAREELGLVREREIVFDFREPGPR
jgi:cell division protein FtsB